MVFFCCPHRSDIHPGTRATRTSPPNLGSLYRCRGKQLTMVFCGARMGLQRDQPKIPCWRATAFMGISEGFGERLQISPNMKAHEWRELTDKFATDQRHQGRTEPTCGQRGVAENSRPSRSSRGKGLPRVP